MMKNVTPTPNQKISIHQLTLDEMFEFHRKMVKKLTKSYEDFEDGKGDPEKIKLISHHVKTHADTVKSLKTMIECERMLQPQTESSDEGEQTSENQPAMEHMHPVIHEYEENLPVYDEPKEIIKNIKVVAPTPAIRYNLDGFRPYAKMCDLFKSHAPIKIAGGTYDAGKTYSCVAYIDMLARQYPGARLTFIHRNLNRIYRNIIPTYEKYLGFRPTARTAPNPTPIVKHGGEQPIFFEYWNGSRIYMNGLDNPNNSTIRFL